MLVKWRDVCVVGWGGGGGRGVCNFCTPADYEPEYFRLRFLKFKAVKFNKYSLRFLMD